MNQEEFADLQLNCVPQEEFKLDWDSYYTLDFASTFLPKVIQYKDKGFHFFDGAEFLLNKPIGDELMKLYSSKVPPLSAFFYTYPKVLRQSIKKQILRLKKREFAFFANLDKMKM